MTGALWAKRGVRDISRSCRAPRDISRSPRLAPKAPVMQAKQKRLHYCFQVPPKLDEDEHIHVGKINNRPNALDYYLT